MLDSPVALIRELDYPVSDLILINITGRDKPGITSSITSIMAGYDLDILDIRQSVIHDTLSVGVLVRLTGELVSVVLKELAFHLHNHQLQFSYQSPSIDDYEHWAVGQSTRSYTLTLLSRRITAEQIARVSGLAAAHGLTIDGTCRRMS